MTINLDRLTIDDKNFYTETQRSQLKQLLASSADNSLSVEQLWQMMDDVWDRLGCDNQNLNWDKISVFYNHPVWILNGLFIEQDELSMKNRKCISDWIALRKEEISQVVDYGGGMGILAQLIAQANPKLKIDIYEPYPTDVAIKRLASYSTVQFVDRLRSNTYDCLVSTDVLEHVADPLNLLAEMITSVRPQGYLIIANCFNPVIKCHLPQTFHLRYTFNQFAKLMGLKSLGRCFESHGTVYIKEEKTLNWKQIRQAENISKSIFPLLNLLHQGYKLRKKIKL
jgi:2-polyprenyl-3-methyl-5-hydroxy-6-metoxy-1,4-benzoquinol methylase